MNQHAIRTEGVREQCVLVSDAISSTISTLLGPGTKFKCITDEDGAGVITRSVLKVLEHLDVENHPVGKAYKQCCEGYIIYVGESGLCTLVTLIGILVKKGNELESQGIPLINVMEGFRTAANVCKEVLESITISLATVLGDQQSALRSTNPQHPNFENNMPIIVRGDHKTAESNLDDDGSDESTDTTIWQQLPPGRDENSIKKQGEGTQLTQMLAKLGVSTPSSSIPELQHAEDEDVAWFFEEEDEVESEIIAQPSTVKSETSTCYAQDSSTTSTTTSTAKTSPLVSDDATTTSTSTTTTSKAPRIKMDWLDLIAGRLAHGNNQMVAMAVQAARLLGEDDWNMRRLVVRRIGFDHESVIDGLLVPLRQDFPFVSSCSCTANPLRPPDDASNNSTTTVNGSETRYRVRHGRVCVVDGSVGAGRFNEVLEGVTQEVSVTEWYDIHSQADANDNSYNERILTLLEGHNVALVVTSGDVKQSFIEAVHARGIHVLPNIQGIDWDYFCYLLDDYPLGDLDDLTDEDSLSPVMCIESFCIGGKWQENTRRRFRSKDNEFTSKPYIRITTTPPLGEPFQTSIRPRSSSHFPISVVVGGATKVIAEEKERLFWSCLHKLRNFNKQHRVLPGGGFPELKCMLALEEEAKKMVKEGCKMESALPDGVSYLILEAEAVKAFQMCLEDYLIILARNFGLPSQSAIDAVLRMKAKVQHSPSTTSMCVPNDELRGEREEHEEVGGGTRVEGQVGEVYDELMCKMEGYQRAVDAACTILSIRVFIVENQNNRGY